MNEYIFEKEIEENLKDALKYDEFELYLQPRYNTADDVLIGAKSLVIQRSHNISFSQIVSYFEKTKKSSDLTLYIVTKICRILQSFTDLKMPAFSVSVNVAESDLNDKTVNKLCRIIEKSSIKNNSIYLCLTGISESKNSQRLISYIKLLKDSGYLIEMSLFDERIVDINKLILFPIDLISFDFRYIIGENYNKKCGLIISSVMHLAQWLNIPVMAEGIDRIRQAEFLKSIGCNLMQGNMFSPPVSCAEFGKILMDKKHSTEVSDTILSSCTCDFDFWNPENSYDTFENFFLPLGIFEYRKDSLEYVKINKRLRDIAQIVKASAESGHDLLYYVDPQDYDKVKYTLDLLRENMDEFTVEALWNRRSFDESFKLRIHAKCLRRSYLKCTFIAVIEKIEP